MAETPRELSKVSSMKKSIRQNRDSRKTTLENKLQQYSEMCGKPIILVGYSVLVSPLSSSQVFASSEGGQSGPRSFAGGSILLLEGHHAKQILFVHAYC